MNFGSLFAGIGGIDLGFERAGMTCKWQVEKDDYCTKVLEKHWPDVARYRDIRECGKHNLEPVELICGGYPCQPFSQVGKRRGAADDRHLWPEMFRIVQELKPAWVVGENVAGHISMGLDAVLADLESAGYETQPLVIPAAGVGAPHYRYRVFVIGHNSNTNSNGESIIPFDAEASRLPEYVADAQVKSKREPADETDTIATGGETWAKSHNRGQPEDDSIPGCGLSQDSGQAKTKTGTIERSSERCLSDWWAVEPGLGRVAHGVSNRIHRLRCLGNTVVPQVAEVIGRAIMKTESEGEK